VQLAKILANEACYTQNRKGTLLLMTEGTEVLEEDTSLFNSLVINFCKYFNLHHFDSFDYKEISQLEHGYSLMLVGSYGSELRKDEF